MGGKNKKFSRGSTRIPSASDHWVSCVVYLKTKSRRQECGVSMRRIIGGGRVHSNRSLSLAPMNSGGGLRHGTQHARNAVGCCHHPAYSQRRWCARSKCLQRASCIALLSPGQNTVSSQADTIRESQAPIVPNSCAMPILPDTLERSVEGHLTLRTPPECTLSAFESLGSCC